MGLSENNKLTLPVTGPEHNIEIAAATGIICQHVHPENTWPWVSWRRERNWDLTFST
jgi:hypothetical protein